MRYYLKKDLPGIKAGTEIKKDIGFSGWDGKAWYTADQRRLCFIPNSEFSDWIEERGNSMWKPKKDGFYYIPEPDMYDNCTRCSWIDDEFDNVRFSRGLVCPTPELAIELADRMLETAKKFWEEKK